MRTTLVVIALGLLIACKDKPQAASETPVAKPTVAEPAQPASTPAPSLPEPAAPPPSLPEPAAPADSRSVAELTAELEKTTAAIDAAIALASDRSQPSEARGQAKMTLPALEDQKRELEALIKQKGEDPLATGEGCTKDPKGCN